MESIALPPFAIPMWLMAAGIFVVGGGLLVLWRGPSGASAIAAALTPFLIPVVVTAFAVIIVSGIGAVLLTVGKSLAVPLALLIALAVLAISTMLAARPTETLD